MRGNVSGLGNTSGTTGTVVVDCDGDCDDGNDDAKDAAGRELGAGRNLGRLAQWAAKTMWWKG